MLKSEAKKYIPEKNITNTILRRRTLTELLEYSDHFLHLLIIMKEKEMNIDTVLIEYEKHFLANMCCKHTLCSGTVLSA